MRLVEHMNLALANCLSFLLQRFLLVSVVVKVVGPLNGYFYSLVSNLLNLFFVDLKNISHAMPLE